MIKIVLSFERLKKKVWAMGRRRRGRRERTGCDCLRGGVSVRNAEVQVVRVKNVFEESYMAERSPLPKH